MNDVVLREATSADFDKLASVQRRAVDVTLREHYDDLAIDEWLKKIDSDKFRRVAGEGEKTIVAETDGVVVGFSSFNVAESHLGMWYVDPDYHGRGIGQRLLEESISELKGAEVATITTEASAFAKPRFESLGWKAEEEYDKPAFGGTFRVTRMVKHL